MAQFPPAYLYMMEWEDSQHLYATETDNNGAGVISGINQASFPSQFAQINATFQPNRGPAIEAFYQSEFWIPMRLGGLTDQDLANRVLDAAVNVWEPEAEEMLQKAYNSLIRPPVPLLAVDGQIGPMTLEAVNSVDPEAMLSAYRAQRVAYYQSVVANHPADATYLAVWLKRAQA